MAELRYDIAVTGEQKLRRVIRSIDQELLAHQRRAMRMTGGSMTSSARRGGGGSLETQRRRELRTTFRGFDEIGKVAAREEMRRHRQAMANIEKEKRAKIRAEQQAAKDAQRNARIAQQARERHARGLLSSAGNATGNVLRAGAGLLGIGGGAVAVNAVQDRARVEGAIADLANQGYRPGGQSRESLARNIRGRVTSVSQRTGRSDSDLVDMLTNYVGISGDLKGGMGSLGKLADIADATGASGADLGKSLAIVSEGIKLKNKNLSDAEVQKRAFAAVRVMAGQGKVGSIELVDQANVGAARTVAAATQFGGDFEGNMATLGGLAQMAVGKGGGASSPDEAFMAISRLSTDAIKHQKALKAMGVDVFTDESKTQLKTPDEILFQAIHKSKGNLSKLDPIFGERSARAMNPLAQMYTEAGGGEAGLQAMRDELAKYQRAAMSDREVGESAKFRRDAPDRQMAKVWQDFNREVGTQLLPVVTQALPGLAKAIPSLAKGIEGAAKLASWFVDNPIKGVGAVILAQVAADVAKAKLGDYLVKLLTRGSGGGGGAPGVPGAAGAGPSPWLVPLAIAAAATTKLVSDQSDALDVQLGYKGPGMSTVLNPFADKKGNVTGETFLQGIVDNLNPFGENAYGSRIAEGISGRINAYGPAMSLAKPKSGKDYDAFMEKARREGKLGVADIDVSQILTEKQLDSYGLDRGQGFIAAKDQESANPAAATDALAASVGGANAALDSFAGKLREWSPPNPQNRGGGPISNGN